MEMEVQLVSRWAVYLLVDLLQISIRDSFTPLKDNRRVDRLPSL